MALVYKYQKIDEWFYKNLMNMEIYCNSPENFNDPFDCQIKFSYLEELEKLIEEKRDYKIMINKMVEQGEKTVVQFLIDEFLQKKFVNDIINSLEDSVKRLLVSSFSECFKNELLWAHYGENHKGVCIEYNIDNVEKVHYNEIYPKLSKKFLEKILLIKNKGIEEFSKYRKELVKELSEKTILTKSKSWGYEEEWRLINSTNIKKIEIGDIKSLYFGLRTDENDKKTILKILKDKGIDIPIYQMGKIKDKFLFEAKLLDNSGI